MDEDDEVVERNPGHYTHEEAYRIAKLLRLRPNIELIVSKLDEISLHDLIRIARAESWRRATVKPRQHSDRGR